MVSGYMLCMVDSARRIIEIAQMSVENNYTVKLYVYTQVYSVYAGIDEGVG